MDYKDILEQRQHSRERLTQYKADRGLSFKTLSEQTGINIRTLFDFLRDKRVVTFNTLVRINDFLSKQEVK